MANVVGCGAVVGDAFDVKPADDASTPQEGKGDAESPSQPANDASIEAEPSVDAGVQPSGPIKYVQGRVTDSIVTPVTSLSAEFDNAVSAGHTIIVALQAGSRILGMSDGRNTYQSVIVDGPNTAKLSVYSALNIADGPVTINVEFESATGALMAIHDYSGITTRDQTSSQNGTRAQPWRRAWSPWRKGINFSSHLADATSASATRASRDFTKRLAVAGNLSEDRVVSGEGTYAATFTAADPAGGGWTAVLASFKGAEKPSP